MHPLVIQPQLMSDKDLLDLCQEIWWPKQGELIAVQLYFKSQFTPQKSNVFCASLFKLPPMNCVFIPPKIDGFGEDKKQINCICVCVRVCCAQVIILFKGD